MDGRCRYLQKVEGRLQDAIVTCDGQVISGLFFFHLFKDCPDVKAFQIHQTSLDRLLVLVVLSTQAEFISRPRVEGIIRRHFGAAMKIQFEVLEEIPLTRSGKRRIVVSHLGSHNHGELPADLRPAHDTATASGSHE